MWRMRLSAVSYKQRVKKTSVFPKWEHLPLMSIRDFFSSCSFLFFSGKWGMEKGSFLINKISDTSLGVGIMPLPLCRHRQRCSHPAASTDPRASCWSGASLLSPSVVVTPLCSLFSSRCFLSIFPFLDPWLGTLPLLGVPKHPPPQPAVPQPQFQPCQSIPDIMCTPQPAATSHQRDPPKRGGF